MHERPVLREGQEKNPTKERGRISRPSVLRIVSCSTISGLTGREVHAAVGTNRSSVQPFKWLAWLVLIPCCCDPAHRHPRPGCPDACNDASDLLCSSFHCPNACNLMDYADTIFCENTGCTEDICCKMMGEALQSINWKRTKFFLINTDRDALNVLYATDKENIHASPRIVYLRI